MKDEIITERDLMLGDVIAFKESDDRISQPFVVTALGLNYLLASPYYSIETTQEVRFNLGGKDDLEIADIPLSEDILKNNFLLYAAESNNYKITKTQLCDGFPVVYDGIFCSETKILYITRIFTEDLFNDDENVGKMYSIRNLQRFLKSINVEWNVKL